MKKIMTFCLVMVLVLSMSVTALAAPGGFLESPSGNEAPRIVFFEVGEGCTAVPFTTAYSDRDTLPAEDQKNFEDAYKSIVGADDLSSLCSGLTGSNLSVSDLFFLGYKDCDPAAHETHGAMKLGLEADTLNNFVALMIFVDGKWQLIENAKLEDGVLVFTTNQFGPMAFVVKTTGEPPKTGDNSLVYLWGILAVLSAGAVVMVLTNKKKFHA